MHKITKHFYIFLLILGLTRCGGDNPQPKSDLGNDVNRDVRSIDVQRSKDMGSDANSDALNKDLGRDASSDAADLGPDAERLPENAPRFPRTFIDLYGDIVNHQNTDPSNFTAERLTIVDGRVLNDQGAPLVDVKVSAPDFPGIGHVLTDLEGNFSFALNGGGVVNLRYTKAGFIDSERRVQSLWHEFVHIGPLVLKKYSNTVTTISFSNSNQIQVARGDIETDSAGGRQATLLVNSNTNAMLKLKDGTTVDMPSLNLRFTEFTVGAAGPLAMPGDLPGTSAYTYAVEISADEAVAMDAVSVEFDKPVYFYVDDFLGFPVGSVVPIGYYDREKHAWIPSDNGKVISIVSVANGKATVDVDGDGAADTGTSLTDLGFSDEELTQLASLYLAGKVLWRGPMTHLTPWDHNFPWGLPMDAAYPEKFKNADEASDGPCTASGSVIECESKILRESVELPGTPFFLTYNSLDHKFLPVNEILVPIKPPSPIWSLQCAIVTIEIAGNFYYYNLDKEDLGDPSIESVYKFRWDGKDRRGQVLQGKQRYRAKVDWQYHLRYYPDSEDLARSFARVRKLDVNNVGIERGGICPDPDRLGDPMATLTNGEVEGYIGHLERGRDLGGWTINAQHSFDQKSGTINRGDGSRYKQQATRFQKLTGKDVLGLSTNFGSQIDIKANGNILIRSNNGIKEYNPADGSVTTIPASLSRFINFKMGPDDEVYVMGLFSSLSRIREGVREPIVEQNGGEVLIDENYVGPVLGKNLGIMVNFVVASDNTIYVLSAPAQGSNNLILWRITVDGYISKEMGSFSSPDEILVPGGGYAYRSRLLIDSRDRLYIVSDHEVHRREDDGRFTLIMGGGPTRYFNEGDVATELGFRIGFAELDRKDRLFFSSLNYRKIYTIENDGRVKYFAGSISNKPHEFDEPIRDTKLLMDNFAFTPNGEFVFFDTRTETLRKLHEKTELLILSEDGASTYIFDETGGHLETRDNLTGNLVYKFSYDRFNRLLSITDIDDLKTTIERDASGNPKSITGPYGHRTDISLNPSGILDGVTNAAGEQTRFTYSSDNLIASLIDPKGNTKTYRFDTDGRLTGETDALGASKTLGHLKTPNLLKGSVTSEMGRTISHTIDTNGDENSVVRTTKGPAGFEITTTIISENNRTIEYPDGRIVTITMASSPYLGGFHDYVDTLTTAYPSGREIALSFTEASEDGDDLSDGLLTFTSTSSINNQTQTTTYDGATKTTTTTSPVGRISYSTLDDKGRIIEAGKAGLLPTYMEYDTDGRLTKITQGTRSSSFGYDAMSNVNQITDSMNRSVNYDFDAVGRTISQSLPDGRTHNFAFDPNGNVSAVQPAGRNAHTFDYNAVDQTIEYSPPALQSVPNPSTGQSYNLDHQPTKTTLADGREIHFAYDRAGRLDKVISPLGEHTNNYSAITGQVESVDGLSGGSLSFEYDGDLVTKITNVQEEVSGVVEWTYDNALRTTILDVSGKRVNYYYDGDGGLIRFGDLRLTRDAITGFVTNTALRSVSSSTTINGYGELDNEHFTFNANDLFEIQHTYNNMGQITDRIETLEGVSKNFAYTYDDSDRLTEVFEDGNLVEEFTFDTNDNVTERKINGVTTIATFDEQDRLISRGTKLYRYNDHGQLNEIADNLSGDLTNLDYDVFGSLRQVSTPDGTIVDYIIDVNGRRVGKRVNGVFDKGWVYGGGLRPIAGVDAAGLVTSLFGYGSGIGPDYMVKGGMTYRIISDHLGSVRQVVNATSGVIEQKINYDVYGRKTLDTNPGFQPFGYAGGLHDVETGFVQFSARDYDPESGRWMAKDPAGFSGENTNLYGYVNGDPINYMDPTGRVPVDFFFDLASIGYNVYRILADNVFGDCDNLGTNLGALGLDLLGLAIPYATGLGMAYRAAKAAKKLDKLNDLRKVSKGCFVADTPVAICDPDDEEWASTQPIETIQEGDYVLSKDERSGQISCEQVTSPTIIPNQEIFRVITRNVGGESSEIEATGNHPFFANGRWIRVDELGPGDIVQSRGDDLEVVEVTRTERFETVYNFTVSNYHTYFVGDDATWVHNTCTSLLEAVSKEAFNLADDLSGWIPKNKHLVDSAARKSAKFLTNDLNDVRALVSKALSSPNARFLSNGEKGTKIIVDMGRVIGTKGQRGIRVVFGEGKVWTAFPVHL